MGLGPAEAYQPPRRPSPAGVIALVGSLLAVGLVLWICGWAIFEVATR